MPETTSIEVKCECKIPFHTELVACLHKLLNGSMTEDQFPREVPHRDEISRALHSKMLFIKVELAHPVKRWRYRIVRAVRQILGKDLVATIHAGKSAITLILL